MRVALVAAAGAVGILTGAVGRAGGWVIAQASGGGGGSNGDLPNWVQWGVLGLVILGFITKQLVPGWLYSDIKAENKELKAENIRLVQLALDTQTKTLPAIEAATRVVEDAMAEIRASKRRS
jgi:hypothetical protein